jgi:hypothetical protein
VLESAPRRRTAVYGQRCEIFVELVIGNLFGQAPKVQAYKGDAAKIIIKGTDALPFQVNLLIK